MQYKFLPPYLPDYNPIELAFSAIKAHICREGDLVCVAMVGDNEEHVYQCLHNTVWSVTSVDAEGWFLHCS